MSKLSLSLLCRLLMLRLIEQGKIGLTYIFCSKVGKVYAKLLELIVNFYNLTEHPSKPILRGIEPVL